MIPIDDLEALFPLTREHFEREIAASRIAISDDVVDRLGLSRAALVRAAIFFRTNVSADETDVDGAGTAFGQTWALAEREILRLVIAAISTPEAKGREVEIVQALARGATVTEAARRHAPAPEAGTSSANVVTLRP